MATLKEQAKHLEELIAMQQSNNGNISSNDISGVVNSNDIPELEPEPSFEVDYFEILEKCNEKAKNTIEYMVSHLLTDDLKDESYILDKKEQDISTLSDLYYQKEMTNVIMKNNVENIRMSGGSPRLYETFVQLSKNYTEINKQIIATESALRQTYTALKHEAITKQREEMAIQAQNEIEAPMAQINSLSSGLEGEGVVENVEDKRETKIYIGSRDLIKDKLKQKKEAIKMLKEEEAREKEEKETANTEFEEL